MQWFLNNSHSNVIQRTGPDLPCVLLEVLEVPLPCDPIATDPSFNPWESDILVIWPHTCICIYMYTRYINVAGHIALLPRIRLKPIMMLSEAWLLTSISTLMSKVQFWMKPDVGMPSFSRVAKFAKPHSPPLVNVFAATAFHNLHFWQCSA